MFHAVHSSTLAQGFQKSEQRHLKQVYSYAKRHLSTMGRRSGENYFQHGTEVANTLKELSNDPNLIEVAILHDLLIVPNGRELLRDAPLSRLQKRLVHGMHILRRLHIDERNVDLDLVIRKFSREGRLLLLRMAHRLNDIRHLHRFTKSVRNEIANESLHMYTVIAGRLGLHKWMQEMGDRCFELLQSKLHRMVSKKFAETAEIDKKLIEFSSSFLTHKLKKEGIPFRLESRIKSLYSSHRKMLSKRKNFREIDDRLALRVIVRTEQDCYRTLEIVHANMNPSLKKFQDFIRKPKANGYQSLHTTAYPLSGNRKQPMEIQIRTEEMDRECEYGIASHTDYKISNYGLSTLF
ncbi:MAG: HD domain-containing protein [bacterium]|nr:HD domain-containing protein [bacterium]